MSDRKLMGFAKMNWVMKCSTKNTWKAVFGETNLDSGEIIAFLHFPNGFGALK